MYSLRNVREKHVPLKVLLWSKLSLFENVTYF
jgi:hypothetical protein